MVRARALPSRVYLLDAGAHVMRSGANPWMPVKRNQISAVWFCVAISSIPIVVPFEGWKTRIMYISAQQSIFRNAHTWLCLSVLLFTELTTSATVQASNTLSLPLNLTSPLQQLNFSAGQWHCGRGVDWVTPTFDGNDCFEAIARLQDVEEKWHGKTKYEFVQPDAYPDHRSLESQSTPRKYAYGEPWNPLFNVCKTHRRLGSCVLGIVIMSDPILGDVKSPCKDLRMCTDS